MLCLLLFSRGSSSVSRLGISSRSGRGSSGISRLGIGSRGSRSGFGRLRSFSSRLRSFSSRGSRSGRRGSFGSLATSGQGSSEQSSNEERLIHLDISLSTSSKKANIKDQERPNQGGIIATIRRFGRYWCMPAGNALLCCQSPSVVVFTGSPPSFQISSKRAA